MRTTHHHQHNTNETPTSQVRVANAADENDYDCSEGFPLLASSEEPTVGDDDYFLEVNSPSTGDVALAGEEYTIEVSNETNTEGRGGVRVSCGD